MKIEPITSLDDVKKILMNCALPVVDIDAKLPPQFFGVHEFDALVAIIGLELFGDDGLLRSLAVSPTYRDQGVGRSLVAFAENVAIMQQVSTLYLLTETAEHFFSSMNYQTAQRSDAPPTIRSTAQFTGLCPASSTFMSKQLL